MTAYPPQILRPDPIALGEGPAGVGNGPVQIVQNSPATGDAIVRNSEGYWVNQSAEVALAADSPAQLGPLAQVGNPLRPARTSWTGRPAYSALKDEAAALITKEVTCVPIRCAPGDVFSFVGMFPGATESGTLSHAWGALFEGALVSSELIPIEQSTDITSGTIKKAEAYAFKLTKAVTVTAAQCPHGYIWAGVSVTATVCSLLGETGIAAAAYPWVTGAPPKLAYTFSVSGSEGVAKNPSGTLTAATVVPELYLY